MKRIDLKTAAEIIQLSVMPACGTASMLAGREASLSQPALQQILPGDVKGRMACPCVVMKICIRKEEKENQVLFFFTDSLARKIAELIMGASQQDLDDIMLSTVKEVLAQGLEASKEALSEFLGGQVDVEMEAFSRLRSEDEMLYWCTSLFKEEVLYAAWEVRPAGSVPDHMSAVFPAVFLEALGIGMPREEREGGAAEQYRRGSTAKRAVSVSDVSFPEFKVKEEEPVVSQISDDRETIQEIPLDISVEIGKTVCTVKRILNLEEGQVLMLDKQAGSPADIVVNGEFIAWGDVFVTDDRFAARITDIANRKG